MFCFLIRAAWLGVDAFGDIFFLACSGKITVVITHRGGAQHLYRAPGT